MNVMKFHNDVMKLDRTTGTSSIRQQTVVFVVRHSSLTWYHMTLVDDRCSPCSSSSSLYSCLPSSHNSFPGHLWACPHSNQCHRTSSVSSTLARNRTRSSVLRSVRFTCIVTRILSVIHSFVVSFLCKFLCSFSATTIRNLTCCREVVTWFNIALFYYFRIRRIVSSRHIKYCFMGRRWFVGELVLLLRLTLYGNLKQFKHFEEIDVSYQRIHWCQSID